MFVKYIYLNALVLGSSGWWLYAKEEGTNSEINIHNLKMLNSLCLFNFGDLPSPRASIRTKDGITIVGQRLPSLQNLINCYPQLSFLTSPSGQPKLYWSLYGQLRTLWPVRRQL